MFDDKQIACMAFNVYLTVCKKYNAVKLHQLEIFYIIGCYGLPFVPSLTYAFVKNANGASIYGPATYWCWVQPEWRAVRLAGFFVPVWYE